MELNKNSLAYWFPRIENLGVPVPKTIITALEKEAVVAAAKELDYPVFLRTDLCSGKHDWKESCFIESADRIENNLAKVLEANIRWQMLGINPQFACVREFLDLETAFVAFAGEMPINKERRYFVKDAKVICSHPYWPQSAFNNHPARMAYGENWEIKLSELNIADSSETQLTEYAEKVGRELGGFWSIDFAKAKNGTWYLLDMALGENSWHWSDCVNSQQEPQ